MSCKSIGGATGDNRRLRSGRSWRSLGGRSIRHPYGMYRIVGMNFEDEIELFDKTTSRSDSILSKH